MTKTELQDIGNEIIEKQKELLRQHEEEWELGRYSIRDSWEEAVKDVCLLK